MVLQCSFVKSRLGCTFNSQLSFKNCIAVCLLAKKNSCTLGPVKQKKFAQIFLSYGPPKNPELHQGQGSKCCTCRCRCSSRSNCLRFTQKLKKFGDDAVGMDCLLKTATIYENDRDAKERDTNAFRSDCIKCRGYCKL